jgi:ribonuclease BN (tRNA processing enzyme)
MKLSTLGRGKIALTPARVRAGLLVEAGSVRLLLDCGSGVLQRLADHNVPWMAITHVALTHFHIDHLGDLPSLIFAWRHGDLPARTAPVEIIGPAGTQALLDRLAAAFGAWVTDPGFPLTVREIDFGGEIVLADGITLACRKVPHTDESVAYSVRHGSHRIVYTGDTGFDEGLAEWAAGCDLMLCECSLPSEMAIPEHLTPEQCAEIGKLAKPGLLALTHFYPPLDRIDVRATVQSLYDGDAVVTHDGWTWEKGSA